MFKIIDLKKNTIGGCKFMQIEVLKIDLCARFLTDLLTQFCLKNDIHVRYTIIYV